MYKYVIKYIVLYKLVVLWKKWINNGRLICVNTVRDGWTYLASVMDLHSKKNIGYAYDTSMAAELATQAVKNACLNVKVTEGILLHSELGTQYTSKTFKDYLSLKGIIHSFSQKRKST